jgi:hypothetical protein
VFYRSQEPSQDRTVETVLIMAATFLSLVVVVHTIDSFWPFLPTL